MEKLMKAMHKNEKGFTLVELMVVVVIIGVLVAIAIPLYQNIVGNANRNTVESNLRIIDGAIQMYRAEEAGPVANLIDGESLNGEDAEGIEALVEEFLEARPEGPDGTEYVIVDVSDANEETRPKAQANAAIVDGNSPDWWTAVDGDGNDIDSVQLPVTWGD